MSQIVSNTAQVKRYNQDLVKNALKELSDGTKNTIARITGLSVATCNTILNELAASEEIIEVSHDYDGMKNVGRPAKTYRFNENHSFLACIYMGLEDGKKTVSYAVVNLLGNVVWKESMEKDMITYHEIENLIKKMVQEKENIKALGIGIPGVVNHQKVVDFCDIEELNDCPLAEKISKQFGLDVVIENDMNAIAYGFYQERGYTEDTSLAVVSFFKDNCAGSGILVDGRIIHGNTNFAGEVAYLPSEYTREEQKKLRDIRTENIKMISKTICSITAIINPETIVLTGASVDETLIEDIYLFCSETIPTKHLPNIRFVEKVEEYYLKGLSTLTLEYMNQLHRNGKSI